MQQAKFNNQKFAGPNPALNAAEGPYTDYVETAASAVPAKAKPSAPEATLAS